MFINYLRKFGCVRKKNRVSQVYEKKNPDTLSYPWKKTNTLKPLGQAKGQLISKCLFGCHRFDQKTNEFFLRISALASKKGSYQKNKGTLLH